MTLPLFIMLTIYLLAGVTHFVKPRMYERIIPKALPWHRFLVYFTGAWELMAALLLCFDRTRSFAAWSIILLLVLVFPANIKMANDFRRKRSRFYWLALLRLPLQLVLIWWAWQYV